MLWINDEYMHACAVEYLANNFPEVPIIINCAWMLPSDILPSKAANIFNDFIWGGINHHL